MQKIEKNDQNNSSDSASGYPWRNMKIAIQNAKQLTVNCPFGGAYDLLYESHQQL